jgi:hypothetical protein
VMEEPFKPFFRWSLMNCWWLWCRTSREKSSKGASEMVTSDDFRIWCLRSPYCMSLCYDSQNKLKTGSVHTLKNGPRSRTSILTKCLEVPWSSTQAKLASWNFDLPLSPQPHSTSIVNQS